MCSSVTQHFGTVISTSSKDYPHVIFCGLKRPLFLFPRSLYFVESRTDLTKSQKSKCFNLLPSGAEVYVTVNDENIVIAYVKAAKSTKAISYQDKRVNIQDMVVISSGYPRKCWSVWLSRCIAVNAGIDLMSAIPNVAYNAFIAVDVYLTEPPNGGFIPKAHIVFELESLDRPIANNDIIYKVEWNLPDRRGLFEGLTDWHGSAEVVKEKKIIRPSPPKLTDSVQLYVMDNRELVWPRQPNYKVVMGRVPTDDDKRQLIEGRSIRADIFYSKFNKFYVVSRYSLIKESSSTFEEYPPLLTRKVIGVEFGGHTEYFLPLTYSCFAGYYTNQLLRNCLVDDPQLLLFDHSFHNSNPIFLAWLRLNEFGRPARFSVSALDEPRLMRSPNMKIWDGEGLIANVFTGSVFCFKFPNLRFLLQFSDRPDVETGTLIEFRAIYVQSEGVFVIIHWRPLKTTAFYDVARCHRGFLFQEQLDCTTVKACNNLYESSQLGLVSDTEEIIRTKAQMLNMDMPKSAFVYVVENEDRNRTTFFNVYCFYYKDSQKEMELLEDDVSQDLPARLWWENINEYAELKTLCNDIYKLKQDNESTREFTSELCDMIEQLRELT